MKLVRLRVRGLRSFTRETEIDLARLGELGLFAVVGPTGAGKSTILDGIFLALFGKCPRGAPSECLSTGATELSVRLELVVDPNGDAREIAVERRWRGTRRREAETAGDEGERLLLRHQPVRIEERRDGAWIPADLGGEKPETYLSQYIVRVGLDDFQQAVVLPQGELDALLRAQPGNRRKLVASLFRTEHLGQPLSDVLRAREDEARGEIDRLREAEREVMITEEDLASAEARAVADRVEAAERAGALITASRRAEEISAARRRCEAKEAAEAALIEAKSALAEREPDRSRVARGKRAEAAFTAVSELERTDKALVEALADATRLDAANRDAEEAVAIASKALAQAIEARSSTLPAVIAKLERATLAAERAHDLEALAAERAASLDALHRATADRAVARDNAARADALAKDRAAHVARASEGLDALRVDEDERAEALAIVAIAEAEAAAHRVIEARAIERDARSARVLEITSAFTAAEASARVAEAALAAAQREHKRLATDAARSKREVERSARELDAARRAEAAASLAIYLRAGDACPVCGSREHPGADHARGGLSISLAERALDAAQRLARSAEQITSEAERDAAARAEEARIEAARIETLNADLRRASDALASLDRGEDKPRAVIDAEAEAQRTAEKASSAIDHVSVDRREEVRRSAIAGSLRDAEARVAALSRRAREAEEQRRSVEAAREEEIRAREAFASAAREVEAAERAFASAERAAAEISSRARAREAEVRDLVASIDDPIDKGDARRSRGKRVPEQRGLFDGIDVSRSQRSPADYVAELSARRDAIARAEATATAAMDRARDDLATIALEAREAVTRRDEAKKARARADRAAARAIAEAGFSDREELLAARMDPIEIARISGEIERLDRALAERTAVYEERARDVTTWVSEAEAKAAVEARDDALGAAREADVRAAQAEERLTEARRRRARTIEIGARIAAIEPRARRLADIRRVVSSNQLAELAAERHLEVVTLGAAEILRTLSSDRYALVRASDGSFAIADAAHGGIIRPPSTLSGGETFLVSLSLALSLSERIQLAGRTRFDFFFLDEGFGSLDAITLDVALEALARLRGPSRVIGMISHVGAVEERMPRKLRVRPARPGGTATVRHEPSIGAGENG